MIEAKAIVELAGKPKNHIEKTFQLVLDEIKKVYEVTNLDVVPVEEKEGVFSTFAEIDMKFKDLVEIYAFCANFLPSSIDVMTPETINVDSKELTDGINDLMATMHQRDMFLKNSNMRVKRLTNNMNQLIVNFINLLTEKGATAEELTAKIGLPQDMVEEFANNMAKENLLKKENDKFTKQ